MSPRNARSVGATRLYTFQGREYSSVTSILRAYPKWALMDWYARQTAEEAIGVFLAHDTVKDAIASLAEQDYLAHEATITHQQRHRNACDFKPSAARYLAGAPIRTRDTAGKRGTAVHEAAELDRDMAEVPENAQKRYEAYQGWLNLYQPTILAKEFQVVNEDDGYAGSGDLIAEVDGVVYLIDLKTSNSVHHEMRLQLAAYRYAGMCIDGEDVDEPATDALFRVERCALLHLTDEGFSFFDANVGPQTYSSFLDVKAVFNHVTATDKTPVGDLIAPPARSVAA